MQQTMITKTLAREKAAAICDVVLRRLNTSMRAQIHILKHDTFDDEKLERVMMITSSLKELRHATIEELCRQFDE